MVDESDINEVEEDSDSDWETNRFKKRKHNHKANISNTSKKGFQTTIKIPILSSTSMKSGNHLGIPKRERQTTTNMSGKLSNHK
jgi:hypothetical protein